MIARLCLIVSLVFLGACGKNRVGSGLRAHAHISKLKLISVYEVDTLGKLEPSGLTYWDGKFYTVSDKDNFIFELKFTDKKIRLIPFVEIENDKPGKLDFEGITHDEEFFYLISELHFQILKISRDGTSQEWIPLDDRLKSAGENVGLFATHNANFEGLCLLPNSHYLIAAERQPRGFIEYDSEDSTIIAYQSNETVFNYKNPRSPDFAGLSCSGSGVYALSRNADAIVKLEKTNGNYHEIEGYSFAEIINLPKYQYKDMTFGTAEGLVVDGDQFFVILDNNGDSFKQTPENNNSLFIEMKYE